MTQAEDALNLYDDDAQKLNEHHYKSQQTAKDSVNHAFEAGRILAEVKDRLPHGKFTAWVKARFEGSSRTARLYMQVHRAVSTGAVPKPGGSAWDYSLNGLLKAAREHDAEPEPEEPAAPREPASKPGLADFEEEVEGEEYGFSSQEEYEEWNDEAQGGASRFRAADFSGSRGSAFCALLQAAFEAIHKAIEEVEGEERAERIQIFRDRLDVYESVEKAAAEPAPKKRRSRRRMEAA